MTLVRESRVTVAAAMALAVAAVACGGSQPCGATTCDVRTAECHRKAAAVAACLRGLPAPTVPVRVISHAEWLDGEARRAAAAPDPQVARWRRGMALLGLVPPGQTPEDAQRAAGARTAAFYDPAAKAVTILDSGRGVDTAEAFGILVHELVHAQQDLAFGLESIYTRFVSSWDASLAFSALVEGDATLIEDQALLALFETDPQKLDWPQIYGGWQARSRRTVLDANDAFAVARGTFAYPFGTPFVASLFAQARLPGIDAAYARPPARTSDVLAGIGRTALPESTVGAKAVPILADTEVVSLDRFGVWLFEMFLHRHRVLGEGESAVSGVQKVAMALVDDRLAVLHDPTRDAIVVSWRLQFVDETNADLVQSWLRVRRFISFREAREVVVLVTDDPGRVAELSPTTPFAADPRASAKVMTVNHTVAPGCSRRDER